jgi:hypothetical protein
LINDVFCAPSGRGGSLINIVVIESGIPAPGPALMPWRINAEQSGSVQTQPGDLVRLIQFCIIPHRTIHFCITKKRRIHADPPFRLAFPLPGTPQHPVVMPGGDTTPARPITLVRPSSLPESARVLLRRLFPHLHRGPEFSGLGRIGVDYIVGFTGIA